MEGWRLLASRGGDETIVNTLTLECFGDAGGRGGVPAIHGVALCAIMEERQPGKLSERPKSDARPSPRLAVSTWAMSIVRHVARAARSSVRIDESCGLYFVCPATCRVTSIL